MFVLICNIDAKNTHVEFTQANNNNNNNYEKQNKRNRRMTRRTKECQKRNKNKSGNENNRKNKNTNTKNDAKESKKFVVLQHRLESHVANLLPLVVNIVICIKRKLIVDFLCLDVPCFDVSHVTVQSRGVCQMKKVSLPFLASNGFCSGELEILEFQLKSKTITFHDFFFV